MNKLTSSEIKKHLQLLNNALASDWQLSGNALQKEFNFADFLSAFDFMKRVAVEAERLDHHPDWCNSYAKVTFRITTHQLGGLSELDFRLADSIEHCLNKVS